MMDRLQPVLISLSALLLIFFPFAGLGARWDWWDYKIGLALLTGIGLTAAILLAIAGVLLLVAVRQQNKSIQARLILTLMVLLIPLGVLFFFGFKAGQAPMIHDISTDNTRPPQFLKLVAARSEDTNDLIRTAEDVEAQQAAYPTLGPLRLSMSSDSAMDLARQAAEEMGWTIADINVAAGRIEATDETFWFGFIDDIVVRVSEVGKKESVIDVRSVSRVGKSDLGKNAQRIKTYTQRLQQLAKGFREDG